MDDLINNLHTGTTRFKTPGSLESAPLPAAPAGTDKTQDPAYRARATQAAVKFESFFVAHMLHQMRSTDKEIGSKDGIFKSDGNSDMLDMADNLVADQIAGHRAFGVADAILKQLLPAAGPAKAAAASPAAAAGNKNPAPPLNNS